MERIPENEQWKLSGDCKKCRRGNYCSTPCRLAESRAKRELYSAFDKVSGGRFSALSNAVASLYHK